MKGIVGFKIIIDEVQAAFKLSQNRLDRDYARIIEQLEEEGEVEMAEAKKRVPFKRLLERLVILMA